MTLSRLSRWVACLIVTALAAPSAGEDVFRESFEVESDRPPLEHAWGDIPAAVTCNAVRPGIGVDGTRAALLQADFPATVQHRLSYWSYRLPNAVPPPRTVPAASRAACHGPRPPVRSMLCLLS